MQLIAPHEPLPLLAQIDKRYDAGFDVTYLEQGQNNGASWNVDQGPAPQEDPDWTPPLTGSRSTRPRARTSAGGRASRICGST